MGFNVDIKQALGLESLGRVLFVSNTGSSTQTRLEGLGRIDKPFSADRAIQEADYYDIIIFFGETNLFFPNITKEDITLIFFSNSNITIDLSNSSFYNCKFINLSSNIININSNPNSYFNNCYFKSLFINCEASKITASNFEACIFTIYSNSYISTPINLNRNNFVYCHIGTATNNGIKADLMVNDTTFEKCKIERIFDTVQALQGGLSNIFYPTLFSDCYFEKTSEYPYVFKTGKYIFERCFFHNKRTNTNLISLSSSASNISFYFSESKFLDTRTSLMDNDLSKVPVLEMSNCSFKNAISTGRIPDVNHNGYVGEITNIVNRLRGLVSYI